MPIRTAASVPIFALRCWACTSRPRLPVARCAKQAIAHPLCEKLLLSDDVLECFFCHRLVVDRHRTPEVPIIWQVNPLRFQVFSNMFSLPSLYLSPPSCNPRLFSILLDGCLHTIAKHGSQMFLWRLGPAPRAPLAFLARTIRRATTQPLQR